MRDTWRIKHNWIEMAYTALNAHNDILSGHTEYNGDIEQIKADAEFIYRLIGAIEAL